MVLETNMHARHLICWKSTFAGLSISLITFFGLLSLVISFGGIGLADGSTLKNASIFTGISFLISSIIALFVGSYYSVRVAKFKIDLMGCVQGLLLGSLFLLIILCKIFSTIAMIGDKAAETMGATASAVGRETISLSQNPMAPEIIEDAIGDLNLKSSPEVVIRRVASKLMRGDQEGAKNYLAFESGLAPSEVDARINTAKSKMDEAIKKAREATATTLKTVGWSSFLLIALGMIVSVLGGFLATKCNECYTLDTHGDEVKRMRANK